METSLFNVANISKVNYEHYIPKRADDQWSVREELSLRQANPHNLVALLANELWCFSLNDDPVPVPTDYEIAATRKSGTFKSDYSKPNLPPHYAVFLKALRRAIYLNLSKDSNGQLIPFGNAVLVLTRELGTKGPLMQLEPHLFGNNQLCVSISIKNLGLIPVSRALIDDPKFIRCHAIYQAPSGIRVHLSGLTTSAGTQVMGPPKEADLLISTLISSHGINLGNKNDLTWVTLIPHLNHLNAHTSSIASYLDSPEDSKKIIWPLELCFAQSSKNIDKDAYLSDTSFDLYDAFDVIDDFIQLKQTSAYRTPGSSFAVASNPLSSEGGYTEQIQHYKNNSVSNANNPCSNSTTNQENVRYPPNEYSPIYSSISKLIMGSEERYTPEFLSTPTGTGNELFTDRRAPNGENSISPVKSLRDAATGYLTKTRTPLKEDLTKKEQVRKISSPLKNEEITLNIKSSINQVTNGDLFGDDDDDDDLFGDGNESSTSESSKNIYKLKTDEITEDMFGMSDDDDKNGNDNIAGIIFSDPGKPNSIGDKFSRKRKYLDIPIDEMTLSNSPLYTDPGAPLPIETPKDRKKSVFAPLNFNPIIESNVDSKYKNGGKFSIKGEKEEALNFDVSMNEVSSSEEEESDSSDDIHSYNAQTEYRYLDSAANESSFYPPLNGVSNQSVPTGLIRQEIVSGNLINTAENIPKDGLNSIWKIPQHDIPVSEDSMQISGHDVSTVEFGSRQENTETNNTRQNSIIETGYNDISGNDEQLEQNIFPKDFINNIPFLLRHIPIASIPSIFLQNNPVLANASNYILDLISEQLVMDNDYLEGLEIPEIMFQGAISCHDGLIKRMAKGLFGKLEQLRGNDIIADMYELRQPYVLSKKDHELIKIKSDSTLFARYLNLRPPNGIKNFKFLMLTDSSKEDCVDFVSNLSQSYIGHEFGFCELLKLTDGDSSGLIHVDLHDDNKLLLLSAQIVTYCSTNKMSRKEVSIMLGLPLHSKTLHEVVEKISKFQLISLEVKNKMPEIELYLKLIPMDLVKSQLTSLSVYNGFCMGIYNMLPPKNIKFTQLADSLSDEVKFRTLTTKSGSPMVYYDSYIHLAYSRTADKKWIFAALSDSSGSETMIKSWYVGSSKDKFDEACGQIWSLALSSASKKHGKICLILTRLNGILPDDELMNWRVLSGRNVHLAVVCVDDNTKIALHDTDNTFPNFKTLDGVDERKLDKFRMNDYEIRDISQDIYAIVFEFPLPLVSSQHRCAIKSGALIKFSNENKSTVIDKFEVNLLNCPHSDSKNLLENILQEFRNLAALNVWFGVSNGENGHVPWHILAVKKMMRSLTHLKIDEGG